MRKREEEHKRRHDEEGARAREDTNKAAREAQIAAELDAQAAKVAAVSKTPAALKAAAKKMRAVFANADVAGELGSGSTANDGDVAKGQIVVKPDQVLDATELRFRFDVDDVQVRVLMHNES